MRRIHKVPAAKLCHLLQRSDGFSEFFISVSWGNFRGLHAKIQSGADLNQSESTHGETILYAIIFSRNVLMVREVLRAGADPNIQLKERIPPLNFAIVQGVVEIVKALLDNGADIHAKEPGNLFTALHFAALHGFVEICQLLIDRGIDVDVRAINEKTPLFVAVQVRRPEVVQLLIARGADVSATFTSPSTKNTTSMRNHTSLCLAANFGYLDIVDILIKAGADVNMRTSENLTVLHGPASSGPLKLVKMLLDAGAGSSVNIAFNPKGYTPLLLAASAGRTDIVKALLEVEGIDVNPITKNVVTPLIRACSEGHLKIVQLLISSGASVNTRTFGMMTPLHIALNAKKDVVAEFLIECGAEINAADTTHTTPLHKACEKGVSLKIIKTLVRKGCNVDSRTDNDMTPLHFAAKSNHLEIVKFLTDCGADCDALQKDNWTVLHYATSHGNLEMVTYLTTKVSSIDAVSTSLSTPLHHAVEKGHGDLVDILLKSGANFNAQDVNKRTPLHIALEKGYLEIAQLLLTNNVLLNVKEESEGCTPLFLAVKNNHEKLVSLLLQKGADVNAGNKYGVLPIHVAVKVENLNVVNMLLAKGAYFNVKADTDDYSGTPLEFGWKTENAKIILQLETNRKLFSAALKNNFDQIERCIQAGAVINARNATGLTALHYAVSHQRIRSVKALLASDADINLATDDGYLPLHFAVAEGREKIPVLPKRQTTKSIVKNYQISKILLAHANNLSFIEFNFIVNAKTIEDGCSMLHTAAESNQFRIVQLLLKNGAAYNIKNNFGKTPVELSTMTEENNRWFILAEKLFEAVKKKHGSSEVMQILKCHYFLVNAREIHSGGTPLYWSILEGRSDIACALLSMGADCCLVTNDGTTPLHVAASLGNVKIVKMLVKCVRKNKPEKLNEFLNAKTVIGSTALHVASKLEVVVVLLQAGACYDIHNGDGKTALAVTQNDDVKRLLRITHQIFDDAEKGISSVANGESLTEDEFSAVMATQNSCGQTLLQVAAAKAEAKSLETA